MGLPKVPTVQPRSSTPVPLEPRYSNEKCGLPSFRVGFPEELILGTSCQQIKSSQLSHSKASTSDLRLLQTQDSYDTAHVRPRQDEGLFMIDIYRALQIFLQQNQQTQSSFLNWSLMASVTRSMQRTLGQDRVQRCLALNLPRP